MVQVLSMMYLVLLYTQCHAFLGLVLITVLILIVVLVTIITLSVVKRKKKGDTMLLPQLSMFKPQSLLIFFYTSKRQHL